MLVAAAILLLAGLPSASAQPWRDDKLTAQDLLENGMEAASDREIVLARQYFERVISEYPSSPEATKARYAISMLEKSSTDTEVRAAIRADQRARVEQFRRAFLVDVGDRVFFADNSAVIGGRARSIIEHQARWLKVRSGLTITIIARSDDGGPPDVERVLSEQRAEAVRQRLLAGGVSDDRISVKALGNRDPLAMCRSPLCQAQNRHVETLINELRDNSGWQIGERQPDAVREDDGEPGGRFAQ